MLVVGSLLATVTSATPVSAETVSEPVAAEVEPALDHDHAAHDHAADVSDTVPVPKVPGLLEPQPMAAGAPQPTVAANRSQHVVLVNGHLGPSELLFGGGKNVNGEWATVKQALVDWGWQSHKIGGTAIYNCDTNYTWNTEAHGKPGLADKHDASLGDRSYAENHNGIGCGFWGTDPKTTSHTPNTSLEHVAYHWAWALRDTFGTECVNAIGHSMGALIIRYALARVEHGRAAGVSQANWEFPLDLCVDDVVTLGGAHSGSTRANTICQTYQCDQMESDSNFIAWMGQHARTAQGAGGTDWTNMGSTTDTSTPAPGSVNGNMDPAHAITYEEDIAHSDSEGARYWKNATPPDITANIRWKDAALGFETTTLDGPWPIRHADMSMAYNQWGCGVGNSTSAFPLKNGLETVGEPYTNSFDCWYYIDVPAGNQLKVRMSSLNNENLDLHLYNTLGASAVCSATTGGATETCTINNTSGRWWARVANTAGTRNPFTIQATTQNDCSTGVDAGDTHGTATAITTPKSNCSGYLAPLVDGEDWYQFPVTAGQRIDASISPNSSADFDLCIYSPGGTLLTCSFNLVGQPDSVSTTASTSGNYRVRVYSVGNVYSGTYTMSASITTPQNDCGTGGDAANTFAAATPITPPASNCSGQLFSGSEVDSDDYYKFTVTSVNQVINASVTPNTGSNYNICIVNPSGTTVAGCSTGGAGVTDSVSYVAPSTGDYRLRVTLASGTGSYTMSLSAASQNDCGTGVDAGGTHAAATSLTLPVSGCPAWLQTNDSNDYYKFPVTAGETITASMSPNLSADFDLCLYTPSGAVAVNCTFGGQGVVESFSHVATTSGDYRLRVLIFGGTQGSYTMTVSKTTPQNDCGIGGDAGGSHAAAASIGLPKSNCSGTLVASSDLEDWYQFLVAADQVVNISMTPNASSDYDLCLYDPSGSLVGSCSILGTGQTDSITRQVAATGNYRMRVFRINGTGSYTMSAWVAQNDCLTATDAGSSHAGATSLVVPKSNCTGMLDTANGDTEDWFQFQVTAGQTINASMTPNASSNFDFCLYHPNGSLVGSCSTLGTGQTDGITHQAAATGNYRLRVFRVTGSGVYTMSVSKSGGPVVIRRDDNERDTSSPYNYNDDLAVKRLPVTSGELSGKTTAKLWILAQAEACSGAPPDNKFRLEVNGTDAVDFNPCNEWSTTSFTWKSFSVPINLLTAGTATFKFEHISGDWTTRDMHLAVDTDTVPDDSDIAFDNNPVNGELMWYLELS